jgi:serine phosphatase RsbU (regulator of sigma subunit)
MLVIQQIFFSTLALSFAIMHLFLYIFRREQKSRLYFSAFLFVYAINVFLDYQSIISIDGLLYLRLHRIVMPLITPLILMFLYSEFDYKKTIQFYILTALSIFVIPFAYSEPIDNFKYIEYLNILLFIEIVRVLVLAYKSKLNGALLISTGFMLFGIFSIFDLLAELELISQISGLYNTHTFGFLTLILILTIHLAKEYSNLNRNITEGLIREKLVVNENEILSVENARKSAELNDARKIQVAMLPKCESKILNYEICFDMVPAVEVGGDFYDYIVKEDGTLVLIIGDATGHGTKAGMMTAIMKTIILSNLHKLNINEFFNFASGIIKKMKISNLYMALMIAEFKNNNIKVSSAGMPAMMIYRKSSASVEEILTKGMPLGAFDNFPYQIKSTEIENGDVVLMMSDGLAELFNENQEQFGYERIGNLIAQNYYKNSNEINNLLFEEALKWKNSNKFDDDITFVVVKYHI